MIKAIMKIFTRWSKWMSFITSETQKIKNDGFGSHG